MSYRSNADLGGQQGHGRVIPEPEGELFHAAWEPQALALTLAMGATGSWNIDQSRSVREIQPDYGSLTYYQLWIRGLERLLVERGLVFADEIAAGRVLPPPRPGARGLPAAHVAAPLAKSSPTGRESTSPARCHIRRRLRTH